MLHLPLESLPRLAAVVICVLAAATVAASPAEDDGWVRVRVTGTIDVVNAPERMPMAVKTGDTVSMTYLIRATTPTRADVGPMRARYDDPVRSMQIRIGDQVLDLAVAPTSAMKESVNVVNILNDYRVQAEPPADVYQVVVAEEAGAGARLTATITLNVVGHPTAALDNTSYLAVPPDPDRFEFRAIHLSTLHPGPRLGYVRARIDRVETLDQALTAAD